MSSVVFAFLLIMVAGGFIAYFGDRLGYVMGKKRVTLFGLRPRHTATALTVIAGVIIGGLALAFLVGVNKAFRVALLTGEQEIRINIRLRHSNAALARAANSNRIAAIDAQNEASSALAQTQQAEAGLTAAEKSLKFEEEKTSAVQQQLATKQAALANLSSTLTIEQRQLAEVRADVEVAESHNQQAIRQTFQILAGFRSGNLTYRNLGEVGRTTIPASESVYSIRGDLIHFLNRLSLAASARGASIGSNGRSVILASLMVPDEKSAGRLINENENLDLLASSIHAVGNGSVVVVASALGNSFDNNQVIIVLRPYPNVLAIRAGTEIAQTVINAGSSSIDDIAAQLQRFLVTQVRPAAKVAGVIPVRNPETGSDELGDVTLEQIYEVVRQVQAINGPAMVTASAATNVYSADQLKLVFGVKPVNASGH